MSLLGLLREKFTDARVPLPRDMQPTTVQDTGTIVENPAVIEYMKREGWTYIGEGLNAVVFGRPDSPWVLRLTDWDPGYLRFWSIAKHSENIHLPEVSRYGKVSFTTDDMEHHVGFQSLVEKLTMGGPNEELLIRSTRDFFDARTRGFLPEEVEHLYPEWRDALELIRSANLGRNGRYKYMTDIHRGNIMYRGDVPVITDPLG